MVMKAFFTALALLALSIGLLLPVPTREEAEATSQVASMDIGPR